MEVPDSRKSLSRSIAYMSYLETSLGEDKKKACYSEIKIGSKTVRERTKGTEKKEEEF